MDTTLDGLLNRHVSIEQPAEGFRVAVDTVLLAAAVFAKAGDEVADYGCGVGGAMLCLAYRVPGLCITGFDIQPELTELCRRNIARNSFQAEMKVVDFDVTNGLKNTFNHVIMNPPYHDEARHDVSAHSGKRIANTEKEGDLSRWIASAARSLKDEGVLTLIHRGDRRDEIINYLSAFFKTIELLPILAKEGAEEKRLIIRAFKKGMGLCVECEPLVLHKSEGGFTEDAEDILRNAGPLQFIPKT